MIPGIFERPLGGGGAKRVKRIQDCLHPAESALAKALLADTVWGTISPQQLQRYCKLADEDLKNAVAAGDPNFFYHSLRKLGGLGTSGQHPNQVYQQMKTLLEPAKFHDLGNFQPPMKRLRGPGAFPVEQHINDPHAMFAQIFEHYPQVR